MRLQFTEVLQQPQLLAGGVVVKEFAGLKEENRQFLKLLARGVSTQEDYRESVDANRDRIVALEQQVADARRTAQQREQAEDTLLKLANDLERVLGVTSSQMSSFTAS